MNENDTIAAICSGIGGSIALVRISGSRALRIGNSIWKGKKPLSVESTRKFILGRILPSPNSPGETAFAVFMRGPSTFTGEDIVEIHAHGGSTNSRRILKAIIECGARQAEPGEFTYRAFANGKIDLTQAEAVCDFITSHNETALNMAERQMDGLLGRKIKAIRETYLGILAECEARVDFPEEELDFVLVKEHLKIINTSENELNSLYETRYEGKIIRDGVRIVIAGKPNAGKSSLMNLLLGYDRAITTDIPGTTRDTLEEFVNIRGIPVKLIDTAGLRYSDDIIESLGIKKTLDSLESSQIILWLLDASSSDLDSEITSIKEYIKPSDNVITVWNKTDLAIKDTPLPDTKYDTVSISVINEAGIDKMLDLVEKKVWGHHKIDTNEVAVSQRHADFIKGALEAIPEVIANLKNEDWELASVGLKSIANYLGAITGEDATLDIYETIFSKFCIGK